MDLTQPEPKVADKPRGRGSRFEIWLLLVLPLVAGAVAGAIVSTQPQQYRATATVVLPLPPESGAPIGAVDQLVSNFQGAVASTPVLQEVSADLGIPVDEIRSGLSTRRVSASNLVEVSYESEDADLAVELVEAQIDEALELRDDLGSPQARTLVAPVSAEPVSRFREVARGIVTAIGVALALAVGLILLRRLLRSSP